MKTYQYQNLGYVFAVYELQGVLKWSFIRPEKEPAPPQALDEADFDECAINLPQSDAEDSGEGLYISAVGLKMRIERNPGTPQVSFTGTNGGEAKWVFQGLSLSNGSAMTATASVQTDAELTHDQEKDVTISKLTKEADDVRATCARLSDEKNARNSTIVGLRGEIEKLKNELNRTNDDRSKLQTELRRLQQTTATRESVSKNTAPVSISIPSHTRVLLANGIQSQSASDSHQAQAINTSTTTMSTTHKRNTEGRNFEDSRAEKRKATNTAIELASKRPKASGITFQHDHYYYVRCFKTAHKNELPARIHIDLVQCEVTYADSKASYKIDITNAQSKYVPQLLGLLLVYTNYFF
jgi:hypothetical protein